MQRCGTLRLLASVRIAQSSGKPSVPTGHKIRTLAAPARLRPVYFTHVKSQHWVPSECREVDDGTRPPPRSSENFCVSIFRFTIHRFPMFD